MVFVDFPNAPATADPVRTRIQVHQRPAALAPGGIVRTPLAGGDGDAAVVPDAEGRQPITGSCGSRSNGNRYLADVAAAVGSGRSISPDTRWSWSCRRDNASPFLGVNYVRLPGRGVAVPGGEVRFGILIDAESRAHPTRHMSYTGLWPYSAVLLIDSSPQPFGHWDPGWAVDTLSRLRPSHPIAWHKWMFRWIDPEQITCLRAAGQLEETLTPTAPAGGKKMIVVPTGASTAYVLEVRRRLGYDRSVCSEGLLRVHRSTPNFAPTKGQSRGRPPALTVHRMSHRLPSGRPTRTRSVKIEVLATDGSAYRVRVTKK